MGLIGAWAVLTSLAQARLDRYELGNVDAIVVFAGAGSFQERTRLAAHLYSRRISSRVILTDDGVLGGWSRATNRNWYFVERAKENLLKHGVLPQDVHVAGSVQGGTIEEAIYVRNFAQRHGLQSLLFVTSAYHSRRALWTVRQVFEGTGIRVGLVYSPPTPDTWWWWLFPSGWSQVPVEWLKAAYYLRHSIDHNRNSGA
jgi:uncharacterized SAM-binding protein YcdF (DUF218 family)